MSLSNKILVAACSLLFVLAIGELSYYVGLSQAKKINMSTIPPAQIAQKRTDTPPNQLVNDEQINYLRSRNKTNNQKFFLTEEVSGKISELLDIKGEDGIIVVDEKGKRVLTFMRMRDGKTKYYRLTGKKKEQINFKDLKVGEDILFSSYTDLVLNEELRAEVIVSK